MNPSADEEVGRSWKGPWADLRSAGRRKSIEAVRKQEGQNEGEERAE